MLFRSSFDPERWLFEQLSLQLPLVNRCGADCPGPARWSSDPAAGDPRWAALARLGLAQPAAAASATDANASSNTNANASSATDAHESSATGGAETQA